MLNNLDINLVRNTLTRNLKSQFEAASEESLTPINRNHKAKPETNFEKQQEALLGMWSNTTRLREPEKS